MADFFRHATPLFGGGPGPRPAPRRQLPLAPFDPSDDDGKVYTEMPPEQSIPPVGSDPAFMLADFSGVTVDGDYTPKTSAAIIAAGGITMTSGRWKGVFIPYISGANTTPPTQLLTTMAIRYPRNVQDLIMTLHAERTYPDFISATSPWEAPRVYSPAEILAWCRYVATWGFRNVIWYGGHPPDKGPDDMMKTLFDGGVVGYYIHGKEVDIQGYARAEDYTASVLAMDAYVGGRVPCGAHFTANGDRQMSYPIGADREYFMPDWSIVNGRWHCMLQSCGHAPDWTLTSAGRQGASMYYARQRVNLGLVGGSGPGAPDSRVVAFETMAESQLYGYCDEVTGVRRSWEMFCGVRDNPKCRPVAGSGNGLWLPDGNGFYAKGA